MVEYLAKNAQKRAGPVPMAAGWAGAAGVPNGTICGASVPRGAEARSGCPGLLCGGFDCGRVNEGNFGVGEAVEPIDELVDLAVCGVDLALEDGLGVAGFGGGELDV